LWMKSISSWSITRIASSAWIANLAIQHAGEPSAEVLFLQRAAGPLGQIGSLFGRLGISGAASRCRWPAPPDATARGLPACLSTGSAVTAVISRWSAVRRRLRCRAVRPARFSLWRPTAQSFLRARQCDVQIDVAQLANDVPFVHMLPGPDGYLHQRARHFGINRMRAARLKLQRADDLVREGTEHDECPTAAKMANVILTFLRFTLSSFPGT